MPPLDREPRPWPSSSSKSSTTSSRPPPTFPSLKRIVPRNVSSSGKADKAGVSQNTNPETTTSGTRLVSPDNLFSDDGPPIPEKSTLRGTVKQAQPCMHNIATPQEVQTTAVVTQSNEGQPLWPSSPNPEPSNPPPNSPPMNVKGALTPQLTPKAFSTFADKADKGKPAEKSRQARSTEDSCLIEDARRSATELIGRVCQLRSEGITSMESTPEQNKHPQEIHKTQKTAEVRATIRRAEHSSRTLSRGKKSSPYVQRGRTTEREPPRRRSLVMTDSPKPHVGGKLSVAAKGKASTVSSSMKFKGATLPSRLRGPARPISEDTPKQIASKAKTVVLPKQRAAVLNREARSFQGTRVPEKVARSFRESVPNRRVDRKPVTAPSARNHALAPSAEESLITADFQKAVLQQDTGNNDSSHGNPSLRGALGHSTMDITYHSRDSSETEKATSFAEPVGDQTHTRGSSWAAPVYRPKTRNPPIRSQPNSPPPVRVPEEQQRETSVELLQSEDQTKQGRPHSQTNATPVAAPSAQAESSEPGSCGAPLTMNDSSTRSMESNASLHTFAQIRDILVATGAFKESATFESAVKSAAEFETSAEQMSPIDLSRVSSSHLTKTKNPPVEPVKTRLNDRKWEVYTPNYPRKFKEDIGGPLELGLERVEPSQAEPYKKSLPPLEEKDIQRNYDSHLDAQKKSLLEFHSDFSVALSPVPFDSTLKIDKLPLDFQCGSTSPISRPIKEVKHKRKAVKTVQWHTDLPVRPKGEFLRKHSSGSANRNVSGENEKSKGDNSNTRNSCETSNDLPELSSSATLQVMPNAPLSCLTNSHRGQKLHVSFASPTENNLLPNSTVVSSGSETEKKSSPTFLTDFGKVFHEFKSYALQHQPTPSGLAGGHVASSNKARSVSTEGPRAYQRVDYEKAKRGLRKAIQHGRLLLEPSYDTSKTPVGEPHKRNDDQLDDAVKFILSVKRRLPGVYPEFIQLLNTCPTEQITADQAKHVDAQVEKLFADAPDLLQGFQRFRPAEQNFKRVTTAKDNTNYPMVVTSQVRDEQRDNGNQVKNFKDNKSIQEQIDKDKQIFDRIIASLRKSSRGNSIERLIGSLRDSTRVLDKQPEQNNNSVVSESKSGSLNLNPKAAEFKPLSGIFEAPGSVPSLPLLHKAIPTFPQSHQLRNNRPDNKPDPIYVRANVNGAPRTMGHYTMPARSNIYREALKRDLAVADDPHPVSLKTPLTVNGTTYYSMPKNGLPVNAATSLPGTSTSNKKDCRFAFWDPGTSNQRGLFPSTSRNSRFARDSQADPLWMYTPLVPIRKGDAGESMPLKAPLSHKLDPSEGNGMEAKRLDDHIAKMKLDEFMSRFPMTGRKAQVVPNMKQKYAAEIQHRLELVLYEKKEKEAAAAKLSLL